jgi:DNA invertase Pin-like site-specific DNA recombinase
MREFGVPERNIFTDKQSGKDFQRTEYQRLLRRLKSGAVLVVKSIDRLGRNYEEIQEQWRVITRERGADIVVIDIPLLDTRERGRDLTGRFVADLVLQILCYVAQNERDGIRQRQAEGIASAKARGAKLGRPQKVPPSEFADVLARYKLGEMSLNKAGALLGVSRNTFKSWIENGQ